MLTSMLIKQVNCHSLTYINAILQSTNPLKIFSMSKEITSNNTMMLQSQKLLISEITNLRSNCFKLFNMPALALQFSIAALVDLSKVHGILFPRKRWLHSSDLQKMIIGPNLINLQLWFRRVRKTKLLQLHLWMDLDNSLQWQFLKMANQTKKMEIMKHMLHSWWGIK